jgi:paraquat-inducible protein A
MDEVSDGELEGTGVADSRGMAASLSRPLPPAAAAAALHPAQEDAGLGAELALPEAVMACPDCDLLQLRGGGQTGARCGRCGARLPGVGRARADRALPLTVTALLLLLAAVCMPLLEMQAHGHGPPITATVLSAMAAMARQHLSPLTVIVGITAILLPAFRLGAGTFLLLWLQVGRRPPALATLTHLLESTRPWAQTEILLLGVLVALVKLTGVFAVVPGPGLLALLALLALEKTVTRALEVQQLWAWAVAPAPRSTPLEAAR